VSKTTENVWKDGATKPGQFNHCNLSVQQFFATKNMAVIPTFLIHLIWTLPISSIPRT
jgi:hypothetical protein